MNNILDFSLQNAYLLQLLSISFLHKDNKQEKVTLLKQFDTWRYNIWYQTVNNRMPWLGGNMGILTTSSTADSYWWGTIISNTLEYKPAPWISGQMKNPGKIWYWINEDDCDANRATSRYACIVMRRCAALNI